MYIYLVQEEFEGIPDEPIAFIDLHKAESCFISMVNENFDSNFKPDEFDKAMELVGNKWGFSSWGVRLFTIQV